MEYLRQQSHTYHRLDWNKTLSIQLDVTVTNEAKNKVRSRFTISVVLSHYALLTVGEAEGVVDGATVGKAEGGADGAEVVGGADGVFVGWNIT